MKAGHVSSLPRKKRHNHGERTTSFLEGFYLRFVFLVMKKALTGHASDWQVAGRGTEVERPWSRILHPPPAERIARVMGKPVSSVVPTSPTVPRRGNGTSAPRLGETQPTRAPRARKMDECRPLLSPQPSWRLSRSAIEAQELDRATVVLPSSSDDDDDIICRVAWKAMSFERRSWLIWEKIAPVSSAEMMASHWQVEPQPEAALPACCRHGHIEGKIGERWWGTDGALAAIRPPSG